jgi:polyphosphate kinase
VPATGTVAAVVTGDGGVDDRILNRELSWLDFNARVLALAEDDRTPLLERLKFIAIFSSNLDEFFQVRVAALKDQIAGDVARRSPDGRTALEQLEAIRGRVAELVAHQESLLLDVLLPALAGHGIGFVGWDGLTDHDRRHLGELFEHRIFPVLTPLAVDPGHPFPYISNLSTNLAVIVDDPDTGDRRFARVKVPSVLPRLVPLPDGRRFIALEEVIAANLGALFPGMTVAEHVPFRVTRNADLTLEEEDADDLLAAVEMELRRRRFGRAVRLEVDRRMSAETRELLIGELDLQPSDVTEHRALLDLTGLWAVHALDRPDLKDEPWQATTRPVLAAAARDGRSMFSVLRERELLVHHPYEAFSTSVEEFVRQAADDPRVLAIKMTLYRTSGDSPVVGHLIRAAEHGKQVAVLVELKARFDEQRNIAWAKALERAGVHVVYGLVGLKTHSKCILVVRDEDEGIRRYCHLGTGNYHPTTARLYEDLGLLTCDPGVGADLTQLFNHLTGYSREVKYRSLLVAPRWLRPAMLDLIEHEARFGPEGRIVMKMNSLGDPEMVEALYKASVAGVSIDLIVRGICCLRPGVPGLSETIRVRSIVGRYLEHSRIFYFAHGEGTEGDRAPTPSFHIGSADLMPRNLDRRVEALVPIRDPSLRRQLGDVIELALQDDAAAWELGTDGRWRRHEPRGDVALQERLQARAVRQARAGA